MQHQQRQAQDTHEVRLLLREFSRWCHARHWVTDAACPQQKQLPRFGGERYRPMRQYSRVQHLLQAAHRYPGCVSLSSSDLCSSNQGSTLFHTTCIPQLLSNSHITPQHRAGCKLSPQVTQACETSPQLRDPLSSRHTHLHTHTHTPTHTHAQIIPVEPCSLTMIGIRILAHTHTHAHTHARNGQGVIGA